jgi:hypothetical protein
MKGIGKLYSEFKHSLARDRKVIAPLQIVSRLEEYLTKRFCSVVLTASEMTILPLTSPGQRVDGRKIDMALLEGDLSRALDKKAAKLHRDELSIRAFVEVKYLRNRHRFGFGDATDEIRPTLQNLQDQLGTFDLARYAGYSVSLRGHRRDIYGLVLASCVRRDHEEDRNTVYIRKVNHCARQHQLSYYDLNYPQLDPAYENQPVTILGGHFRASLYTGLWRLRN